MEDGLRNHAQPLKLDFKKGAKVILRPFYLSGKKILHVITLRISHFSSVNVAQRNLKLKYLTGNLTE